jgi:RNA polymerase sigma-70 factor (ECF subfamily)
MNVHVSYKALKTPDSERQINVQVEKLRKRLQVFRPELVHLHATLEQNSAREGVSVSLNLRLPSGQMAASRAGATPVVAIKAAFDDLQEQVSRHKARLREKYRWPHPRRGGATRTPAQVPFEQTMASVKLPEISGSDISSWVNANLSRLTRFAQRELRYREVNGQLRPNLVTPEEVVGETIVTALGYSAEKPERLALEPWLYRLAMRCIDDLVQNAEPEAAVYLDQGLRRPNEQASDEAQLQFHQPDEAMVTQDNIPDRGAATPEQIAYSDEMIAMVEAALLGVHGEDREAFLLFGIEGFSPEEIAMIGDRTVEEVRKSIFAAREHLRNHLPVSNELKEKLLQHTKIA